MALKTERETAGIDVNLHVMNMYVSLIILRNVDDGVLFYTVIYTVIPKKLLAYSCCVIDTQ